MTKPDLTESLTLSELIAKARAGQKTKTDALEPHRATLLKERKSGTSVRIMVEALVHMGVVVSEETLRLWFVRQESKGQMPSSKKPKATSPIKVAIRTPLMPVAPNTRARVAREDI
jgi:hypothetical protein